MVISTDACRQCIETIAIEWRHHHINVVVVVCAFGTTCGPSDAILVMMCYAMCETPTTDNT